MDLILAIALMVVFALVGAGGGYFYRKNMAEKRIGRTEEYAKKLLDDATRKAAETKKEMEIEAKEEVLRLKTKLDDEIRTRRAEMQRSERRVNQREEMLDKKMDNLEKREEAINKKSEQTQALYDEAEQLRDKQVKELERIAGMTQDEAEQMIISRVQKEAYHDAAAMVRDIEAKAKDEGEKKARNIIALAIQKCAADHVAETTVSVINLPNDDMKGRIIGREGRNIRALETATGVDLIIDDTPEAVIVSAFDPVRREIARIAIEKLIQDGRIHPARIEEMVEKAKKEVDNQIREAGEQAIFETGQHGLHPELVKLLGRMRYRTSYGQNVLKHSIEVSHLAGLMAAELGADVQLAKRAGLLHDIGKAVDHEQEGTHVQLGGELARKYHESNDVIHCILAHHNDVEPQTVEAVLVQAADAISAARPGARRESLENYIKRLEKLEAIANDFAGVEKSFAIQSGREIRIMVKPEDVTDEGTKVMAKEIAKRIERELEYPGVWHHPCRLFLRPCALHAKSFPFIFSFPRYFAFLCAPYRRPLPGERAIIGSVGGSVMVVIGEEYLLMNLLMDTLCLTAAMRLSSLRARPGRVLLAALAGALLSMIALSLWGLRASAYAALPIAVLMALLAFGLRRAPGGSARLLIAGLLSAGMAQYMHRLGLGGWAAALACAPGVLYAVHLLLRWQSRAGERADVRLLFERGGVSLDGLVDSGNCLRDPVTELPVVVVPYQAIRAYLPPGTRCEQLSTLPRGFRLICVRTASGKRLMMCFRPRGLYVRDGRVWRAADAVVAVSPCLHGRRALLPPTLNL